MRSGYDLPTSIEINGAEYNIRTDYRNILDILIACADPELTPYEQQEVMFDILYIDGESIPLSDYRESCEKAVEFIDCGSTEEKKKSPRLIDWEQDAGIIVPAVNKVAGKEIRALARAAVAVDEELEKPEKGSGGFLRRLFGRKR